jgi:hypothetical protein
LITGINRYILNPVYCLGFFFRTQLDQMPFRSSALACPEICVKWFLFFSCLFGSDTGLFDRQILAVLKEINHGGARTNPPRSGVFDRSLVPKMVKNGFKSVLAHLGPL